MIINPELLMPFGKEPDFEAAREYRSQYLTDMLNECMYFKPFDVEINLYKIARGGILHRIRNNPGVNIYIPGYCNVLIGYFPGSIFQIPFPYLLMSERNRDIRMIIFSEAAGMVKFLNDIRNDYLKFDNYMAEGLSKGYFLSIRLQHSNVDNSFSPQTGYNIPFVTGYKIPPHSEITDELFNSQLYGKFNWPGVSDIDYNSHFGVYSKTKSEIFYTPKELILMEHQILNRCAERIANNET